MPTLTDQLAASAAARLRLPPGRLPCEEADRFTRFIKVESQRLRIRHKGGGGGREICQGRAELIDLLLRYALDAYLAALDPKLPREPLALAALGGYGRAELNPRSDIDILLLHDRRAANPSPLLRALMEKFVPFLWTIGLECHPLVRNLDDCVREANRRMESKTALLEARLVWGDRRLFAQMRVVFEDRCLKGRADDYIRERMDDQELRHAKSGNSHCLLEPNTKIGVGGLRDFQSLLWMASAKFRVHQLDDLIQRGVLAQADARLLEHSYDFLLRVRTELHYQQDRKSDLLTRALQPAVAYQLGYTDRSLGRRVEKFMGDYYRATRGIHLITRNLERRLALRPPSRLARLARLGQIFKRRRSRTETVVDGLRIRDGELLATGSQIFRDQPRRLIRTFLVAQQRDLQLHPDLEDLIRRNLALVDRSFLSDLHVHKTFLEILNQRGNVARPLRAMHETGLLGRYIPAFHRLTCRVQHEFYHLYTADEHTLVCLQMLDRIWDASTEPFAHYTELFRSLDRPYVLYLALLLHDVGKATAQRDHERDSERVALSQTRRLQLAAPAATAVAFLVRHHLLMAQLSQKLDLDDPEVIRSFASTVQTTEHLHLLTLHTFADAMGTSEALWTPFKESLLWTLHRRTAEVLSGVGEFRLAAEERLLRLQSEVRRLLPRTFSSDEIDAHFRHLPERYFLLHSAREIANDLQLVHRFMWHQLAAEDRALEPVISWHAEPDRGYSVLKVCTWDRPRLFNRIAGALAAARLNILGARIFTRPDGPVFDTLFVNDPESGKPAGREARESFDDLVTRSLRGESLDFTALIARHQSAAARYRLPAHDLVPNRVSFDNTIAPGRTVIEIQTEDRIGLLFELTRALADLGLDITFARINTEKGAAVDTFYVEEITDGKPTGQVRGKDRLHQIERRLLEVLAHRAPPNPPK